MKAIESNLTKAEKTLPEEWKWVKLGEHVTKIGSGITPRGGHTTYLKSGIPLIRSQNVHMNRFEDKGLVYISTDQDDAMKLSRVSVGDVLLNITGASIGRVCVAPQDLCPANVNQHVAIIRSNGSLEPSFLAYYISTPDFQKYILDTEAGATRQALTKTLIENFKIPLPPLVEQRRIVGILSARLSAIEKARAATIAQLEAAKALPAAYLRQVFESPEAQRWKRKRLGEVLLDIEAGKCVKCDGRPAAKGEWGVLKVSAVSWGEFRPEQNKALPKDFVPSPEHEVKSDDLLISRANTTELVGAVVLVAPNTRSHLMLSDKTLRLVPTNQANKAYLELALRECIVRDYIEGHGTGTSDSMKNITQETIKNIPVLIPSISKQIEISEAYRKRQPEIARVTRVLQDQLDAIDQLPAALLRQAFNGEL